MDLPPITSSAQNLLSDAARRLDRSAAEPVEDPSDVASLVELNQAVQQGHVGARLLRTGKAFSDALLDLYA